MPLPLATLLQLDGTHRFEADAYRYEQNITIALSQTEDAREAQAAFIEKRKPVFKGR